MPSSCTDRKRGDRKKPLRDVCSFKGNYKLSSRTLVLKVLNFRCSMTKQLFSKLLTKVYGFHTNNIKHNLVLTLFYVLMKSETHVLRLNRNVKKVVAVETFPIVCLSVEQINQRLIEQ